MFSKFTVLFLGIFLTVSVQAGNKDFRIFDLRKSLPLTEKEISYFDYYLSMGEDHGVKAGDVINVYRRVPLVDNYRTINHDDMQIAVAQLKVIYTQKTMSIGRVIKRKRPENMPVLEFEKIMVGDRVELADTVVVKKEEVKLLPQKAPLVEMVETLPAKTVETKEVSLAPVSENEVPQAPEALPIQENLIVNGGQD